MNGRTHRGEKFLVGFGILAGGCFLLKMCYLSIAFNAIFGVIFLALVYFYFLSRQNLRLPVERLVLVFAALQVDALGNYFRLYGQQFGPMHYDEFAHLLVQVLVTPTLVWLTHKTFEKCGHNLQPSLARVIAATVMFSLTAAYEIIELWDELYFGGQRIWSKYDTAQDLQWDLLGILIGLVLESILARGVHESFLRPSDALASRLR